MQSASPSVSSSDLPDVRSARPSLLIVDDEEGPRQSLKIVFKKDYDVLLACSGEEALRIASENDVDVAVLDIMMAGMSGVDLLGRLKELNSSIEVIMLTAFETLDTARQALRYGACDYLNKPFDISTIRSAVTKALDRHRVVTRLHGVNDALEKLQCEIEDQRLREEIIRTKGDIYASVLHDINSPLTVISGFVEVINCSLQNAASIEGEELDSMREDLSLLSSQVTRCFEISRRYLSFLRESAVGPASVSLRQILDDLRELLARHPSAEGHQLRIHTNGSDLTALINGTDLLQILLNLTINALQCTQEPHSVDVSVRWVEEPFIPGQIVDSGNERLINAEGFHNQSPLLALTIRDDGPGIPSHVMQRLFDHQFTTKEADCGTGLGLSIVKRLVKQAKAAIHVRTKLDLGSTFTLYVQGQR